MIDFDHHSNVHDDVWTSVVYYTVRSNSDQLLLELTHSYVKIYLVDSTKALVHHLSHKQLFLDEHQCMVDNLLQVEVDKQCLYYHQSVLLE